METVRILLAFVWLAAMGSSRLPERDLLAPSLSRTAGRDLLVIASAEIGTLEATGNNDGKRVEEYLAAVGLPKGHPYCAAFISWVFKEAGYNQPRTGWSPALFPVSRSVKTPVPGNVFGIYFPAFKRIAHCGFVSSVKDNWIGTIEANTNVSGSRDGEGVHRRMRHARTIYRYADWTRKGVLK